MVLLRGAVQSRSEKKRPAEPALVERSAAPHSLNTRAFIATRPVPPDRHGRKLPCGPGSLNLDAGTPFRLPGNARNANRCFNLSISQRLNALFCWALFVAASRRAPACAHGSERSIPHCCSDVTKTGVLPRLGEARLRAPAAARRIRRPRPAAEPEPPQANASR